MDQTCANCGASLAGEDNYRHNGKSLCEDCFLDSQTISRTCDPWAVYTASRTGEQQGALTPMQEEIMHRIKTQGPMAVLHLCREVGITPQDLERDFTPLRHMQLLRAYRQDDQIFIALFQA